MNSGCICCSLVGDFGTSLKEVVDKYHPDRIIIEPSGVGKLSDVIKAVKDLHIENEIRLNSASTVADASKVKVYMKNFGEFFNNQIEHAGTIILSRTQNVSEDKLKKAIELIRTVNANAHIITTPWDDLEGTQILGAMENVTNLELEMLAEAAEKAHEEHEHEHHHHHDGEECCCGHHHDEDEHDHHHDHDEDEHEHHHHHDAQQQTLLDASDVVEDGVLVLGRGVILKLLVLAVGGRLLRNRDAVGIGKAGGRLLRLGLLLVEQAGALFGFAGFFAWSFVFTWLLLVRFVGKVDLKMSGSVARLLLVAVSSLLAVAGKEGSRGKFFGQAGRSGSKGVIVEGADRGGSKEILLGLRLFGRGFLPFCRFH